MPRLLNFCDMQNSVAVVILNYNGQEMLARFLPSVIKNSSGARIVVADNGSTDSSVDMLRKNFYEVEVMELGQNYGFAEGYNRALATIEARYFVLLNSDVEVTPDWLQPLYALMEKDREIVACQPKIRAYNSKDYFEYAGAAGGFIDAYGYPYCRGRILDSIERDCGQYDEPCNIFWATGAALMVRSSWYEAVGGLDSRFFAHMEEIDLCWRILSRGGKIMAVPASVVYHVGAATLKKNNPQKTYLNFRNNLLLVYKNMPDKELRRVMRVRRILDYVAAFKFLLSGDVGGFKAVLKARKDFKKLKGSFLSARDENIKKSVVVEIRERGHFSILWKYYVTRKRYFSQL